MGVALNQSTHTHFGRTVIVCDTVCSSKRGMNQRGWLCVCSGNRSLWINGADNGNGHVCANQHLST